MRRTPVIVLRDEERETSGGWSRGRSTPMRLVLRAKFMLAAAVHHHDGLGRDAVDHAVLA